MDPNRPGPRGGFFAVPCGPNHGSFALRRRILRCKIRGRVMTRPYGMNTIRRAETSDRSGGFTRLPSSKTYQARVWLRARPGDEVTESVVKNGYSIIKETKGAYSHDGTERKAV